MVVSHLEVNYIGFLFANVIILIVYCLLFYISYDRKATSWNLLHMMAIGCAICEILGGITAQFQAELNASECKVSQQLLMSVYWAAQGLMRSVFTFRITMLHQMQSKCEQTFNTIVFRVWVAIGILIVIWSNLTMTTFLSEEGMCTFTLQQQFLLFVSFVPMLFDIIVIFQFAKYLRFFDRCRRRVAESNGLDRKIQRLVNIAFVFFVLLTILSIILMIMLSGAAAKEVTMIVGALHAVCTTASVTCPFIIVQMSNLKSAYTSRSGTKSRTTTATQQHLASSRGTEGLQKSTNPFTTSKPGRPDDQETSGNHVELPQ
jgi:hypothetical protein